MILEQQPVRARCVEVSVGNCMDPHKLLTQRIGVELLTAGANIFHGTDQKLIGMFSRCVWSKSFEGLCLLLVERMKWAQSRWPLIVRRKRFLNLLRWLDRMDARIVARYYSLCIEAWVFLPTDWGLRWWLIYVSLNRPGRDSVCFDPWTSLSRVIYALINLILGNAGRIIVPSAAWMEYAVFLEIEASSWVELLKGLS
jgi:hypothetical protein